VASRTAPDVAAFQDRGLQSGFGNAMYFRPGDKVAMFIDGVSLYFTSRKLGIEIDFRRLLEFFQGRSQLIRAHYYARLEQSDTLPALEPLANWLAFNGYVVIAKSTRQHGYLGGAVGVDIAVDMLELAPQINHAVLFAGAADYLPLVKAMQRKGVLISLVSAQRTTPAIVSDELRRQADQFIDLADIGTGVRRR
jgi:uncharacterized LabA/DUF88 family protein